MSSPVPIRVPRRAGASRSDKSPAAAVVRPCSEDDIPAVAALFGRVYPQYRWASQPACVSYFREIFFNNPWRHLDLPSWLAEEQGEVVGFLGVVPRPMWLDGHAVRVAVSCQFMVDPERRHSLTALHLLRRYLSGPQDIALTDGANDASRRVWQAAGGQLSPLYCLHWMRLLRPTRSLLHLISGQLPRLGLLAALGTPFAMLADAYAGRFTPLRLAPRLREEELDAAGLLAALDEISTAFALRPAYDLAALDWLLAQAREKTHHGTLQSRLLREGNGRLAGWFMYYLNSKISRVIQLGARPESAPAVVEHLFYHAWRRGAFAVEGRMEPRLLRVLGDRRCLFHDRDALTLVHARDRTMLDPLLRGDAFLTRLEAEWWTHFRSAPDDGAADAAPVTGC